MLRQIGCLNVLGGWQTHFADTDITFGPVFNRIQDLWDWQKANLYQAA